eukprot:CAMPEP_0113717404 /NCGR_PEP_ID=MMETSP0038_2-20120614/34505_1 /TAXON_ID=2898 /ORGANISM="Cryptomonas paramecium" /LENGTH=437 /DNA_ID=CAMNT_0000645191 /DNA_START=543 /DNA_END=1853 /DNA_ORIENTATION=+ /assembly_acc=CAM_ASM_000170
MIFGHLIAFAENLHLASKQDFRDNYLEGTQDGMWFSVVTMSTVGFGDLVPRTSVGRFLAIVWIFVSIILMAIFYAIVAAEFSNLVLVPERPIYSVNGPNDLTPYKVVTARAFAQDRLLQRQPNMTLTKFPQHAQAETIRAVLNDTFDAVVDQQEILRYYNLVTPEFQGTIRSVGAIFNQVGVAFGMPRTNATTPHPLHHLISLSVSDVTRRDPDWQQAAKIAEKWFGVVSTADTSDPDAMTLESEAVTNIKNMFAGITGGLFGLWMLISAVLTFFRYPTFKSRARVVAALQAVAKIDETGSFAVMKTQAIEGLGKLVKTCAPPAEAGSRSSEEVSVTLVGREVEKDSKAGSQTQEVLDLFSWGPKISVRLLLQEISKELSNEERYPRLAMPFAQPSPRHGRNETLGYELARDVFIDSYNSIEAIVQDWQPFTDDLVL